MITKANSTIVEDLTDEYTMLCRQYLRATTDAERDNLKIALRRMYEQILTWLAHQAEEFKC